MGLLNSQIQIYSDNATLIRTLTGQAGTISFMTYLPSGSLVSASSDGSIFIWNLNSGTHTGSLVGHTSGVRSLDVVDANTLASVSNDGYAIVWNLSSLQAKFKILVGVFAINCCKYLQNGLLATGDQFNHVYLFNLSNNGSLVSLFSGHGTVVLGMDLIKKDSILASSDFNQAILLWSLPSGSPITKTMQYRHTGSIVFLKRLSDSSLASGSTDSQVHVWDFSTGNVLILANHTSTVNSLELLTNGLLLSGSNDGTVKVWNTTNGYLVKTLSIGASVLSLKYLAYS